MKELIAKSLQLGVKLNFVVTDTVLVASSNKVPGRTRGRGNIKKRQDPRLVLVSVADLDSYLIDLCIPSGLIIVPRYFVTNSG